MLVCLLDVSVRVFLDFVDEVVIHVLAELLDIVISHIASDKASEPSVSRTDILVVFVVAHLHLSVELIFQHAPLVLVALALQYLVE